jgi:hypothetical protein
MITLLFCFLGKEKKSGNLNTPKRNYLEELPFWLAVLGAEPFLRLFSGAKGFV